MELREQADRVHLERRRVDDPLEAVGRDVVAAVDAEPVVGVRGGQPQDRPDDLAEHRAEVGAGVLGVVDLRPEPGLADREAAGQRRGRHPDVDPELADVVGPVVELEVVPDEVAADAEVATDRLADPVAVEGPCQRVGDGVGDRAVVLVARVERGHVVVAALDDRAGEQLDPLRDDRAEVAVDDDERLDLEGGRDLEDRPQRGALAADAVDLRVGEADAREPVRRADEEDLLDVVGRLGLDDDAPGAVGRAGVAVDEDRPEVGEVLDEAGLRRPDDVADRRGVLEARDADHDVGTTEAGDLVADGRCQGCGHECTVPPVAGPCYARATLRRVSARARPRPSTAGSAAGQVARVGGLVRHPAEPERAPRPEPRVDRRPDERAAPDEPGLAHGRLEDPLPLEQRDVEERLVVEPEDVDDDERHVARLRRPGLRAASTRRSAGRGSVAGAGCRTTSGSSSGSRCSWRRRRVARSPPAPAGPGG